MLTTFLLTVVLSATITVALSALGIYLFAEAKWRDHPLAQNVSRMAGRMPV